MGSGGGIIRPNGILIPVDYAGHLNAAENEIEARKIEKTGLSLDTLLENGYIIIHDSRGEGWNIEYEKPMVSMSALKELADYFIVHDAINFHVHFNGRDHDAYNVDELERIFGV
jgi:hypothetical protein